MIEIMLVFHPDNRLYFCSTEPEAIADVQLWLERGKRVVILPIDEEVFPLFRGQRVALGSL